MRTSPFTPDRTYSTPASIDAFCRAVADRRKWLRGEADEPHLAEPHHCAEVTAVRRAFLPPAAFLEAYNRGYDQGYRAGVRATAEDTEPCE